MTRMTTTDFNPFRGRRRTIKKPTKMKVKTRQPGRSEARWSSKKKKKTKTRPPKHINRRGGLMQPRHRAAKAYQWQRQYYTHTFNNTMLPKHINCRGSTTKSQQHDAAKAYQLQRLHQMEKRRITETLQQPGSQHGQSRSIKWRGY